MALSTQRLYLSAPRVTEEDIDAVAAAMRSGWLAPVGPDLSAFEHDIAEYLGVGHAVGLASGTAGIHLGLKGLGVGHGDFVIVPTVTFGATAFPVTYLGATPVFVDIDSSWNLDVALLQEAIRSIRDSGGRVAAVLPVDLYGTPADYGQLQPMLDSLGIPILEDAAEALGSTHGEVRIGAFGHAGILSFNGNKLITTSGGGMLVTDDADLADRVRFWATQARDDAPWYEHSQIGYNYRLSNLLAALGRSQLRRVDVEVEARRRIREWYRVRLEKIDGVTVQSDPSWGRSNAWLTVVRFSPEVHPHAPTRVRHLLENHNIESRPVWKPMHQQPVFSRSHTFLSGAADALFREGLCLPSGTVMTEGDVDRVSSLIMQALRS